MSYDEEYKGKGYCGISMSNNAVDAYSEGKMPLSKWRKKDILARLKRQHASEDFMKVAEKTSLPVLKKILLEYTEYHHTSLRYNSNFPHRKYQRLLENRISQEIKSSSRLQ